MRNDSGETGLQSRACRWWTGVQASYSDRESRPAFSSGACFRITAAESLSDFPRPVVMRTRGLSAWRCLAIFQGADCMH